MSAKLVFMPGAETLPSRPLPFAFVVEDEFEFRGAVCATWSRRFREPIIDVEFRRAGESRRAEPFHAFEILHSGDCVDLLAMIEEEFHELFDD